jgi:hypothetical protein
METRSKQEAITKLVRRHQMDFDGGTKKGLSNWNYQETRMKNLRTFAAVFGPGIAVCLFFSVNVVKLDSAKRLPALHEKTQEMSYIAQMKRGIQLSVNER